MAARHGGLPDLSEGGDGASSRGSDGARAGHAFCMSRREDLETGLTSVAAAYTFHLNPPAPRYRHASWGKRGGRSGGSNHKEKQFSSPRAAGRKTTKLLVSVPRTFYTPLQVREPAETPLWPRGVDSSLYQPSPFHRAQHATCAGTLPGLIVLWLPPYPNPYSKFELRPRSSLEPSFTNAASISASLK